MSFSRMFPNLYNKARSYHISDNGIEPTPLNLKPGALVVSVCTGVLSSMCLFAKVLHEDTVESAKDIRQHREEVNRRLSEVDSRLDTCHSDIQNISNKVDEGFNRLSDKIDGIQSFRIK